MRLREPVHQQDGRPTRSDAEKNYASPRRSRRSHEIVQWSEVHDHISPPTAIRFRQIVPRPRRVDKAGAERDEKTLPLRRGGL
jgi:hypothetical protein